MDFVVNWELASELAGKSEAELKQALITGEGDEQAWVEDSSTKFKGFILDKFKSAEREKAAAEVGRALKTRMGELESVAKPVFEKLGVEFLPSDFKGSLLKLSEKLDQEPLPKGDGVNDLTAEQIKALPGFQTLLDTELSVMNKKVSDIQNEYDQYKSAIEQRRVSEVISSQAKSILDDAKAVWGETPSSQLKFFLAGLDGYKIGLSEDGKNPILLDENGNPARDESRNQIQFKDWVLKNWVAAGHTFHTAPANSGSTNARRTIETGNGQTFSVQVTSQADYERLLKQYQDDPAKKTAVRLAWADFQKGS